MCGQEPEDYKPEDCVVAAGEGDLGNEDKINSLDKQRLSKIISCARFKSLPNILKLGAVGSDLDDFQMKKKTYVRGRQGHSLESQGYC